MKDLTHRLYIHTLLIKYHMSYNPCDNNYLQYNIIIHVYGYIIKFLGVMETSWCLQICR
jgi:hypothetical protein